jgi:hypothetical protein
VAVEIRCSGFGSRCSATYLVVSAIARSIRVICLQMLSSASSVAIALTSVMKLGRARTPDRRSDDARWNPA